MKKTNVYEIEFPSEWVLEQSKIFGEPIKVFIEKLNMMAEDKFEIKIIEKNFTLCRFIVQDEDEVKSNILQIIEGIVEEFISMDKNIAKIEIYQIEEREEIVREKSKEFQKEEEKESTKIMTTVKKINELVGAEEYKEFIHEIINIASELKKIKLERPFLFQNYLFSINDGCGFSTYLNLMAEVFSEFELFKFSGSNKVMELKFSSEDPEEDNREIAKTIEELQKLRHFKGIISIDIGEWQKSIHTKIFKELLIQTFKMQEKNIFVFKVPFLEDRILFEIFNVISDMLYSKEIVFVPFTNLEYELMMVKALEKIDYQIEEKAVEIFSAKICEEKSDGKFYGINTVNKIIDEMLYLKLRNNFNKKEESKVIQKSEIQEILSSEKKYMESGEILINALIGMEEIKKKINEIVNQIKFKFDMEKLGTLIERPCLHMMFTGNPGTGKTTIARILGKVLKEEGILSVGNFYETTGLGLCGGYVGATAPRVTEMCNSARGSILFIDEAYALAEDSGRTSYGKEVINTLITEMENNRENMIVIFAGYEDEMGKLLEMNTGLRDRIPYVIDFPNYSREELSTMFLKLVEKHFVYEEGFINRVNGFFEEIDEERYQAKSFSNGRIVRNLFERVWSKAAMRHRLSKESMNQKPMIVQEDLKQAMVDKEFEELLKKSNNKIFGFKL